MRLPLLRRPLPLLLLFTGLLTFLIQSGELGTADTMHRLQVTHSLWTGQPQVFPSEYPEFGLHGRGGRLFAYYGIGQSLLMLPADLIGSAASRVPLWQHYVSTEADPAIRSIVVSFSTNILLNILTALVCFRLLLQLRFSETESAVGVLALLCATTHLHYAQNMQENNYIFLLTATGLFLQLRWFQEGRRRDLFWGACALGLNLLTRLTTGLDLVAVSLFLGFMLLFDYGSVDVAITQARRRAKLYLSTTLPVYLGFLLVDRLYQWIRFGSWTNTYVSIFAREERQIDPTLPLNYPFSGHFFAGGINSGMIGPFFAPEKSVFLFDPLFPLTLLTIALLWRHLLPATRAFLVTTLLLMLAYLLFYARYFAWAGDFAWGDRYVSSVVEFSTLLTWPLLLRYRTALTRPVRIMAAFATAASVVIQTASLAFWVPLEIYQEESLGHHSWVVFLRFKNIAAQLLGRRRAWGLETPSMFQDSWDAQHITTWNFLPSLLRHVGVAPLRTVHMLYALWVLVGAGLLLTGVQLWRVLRRADLSTQKAG